MMVRLVPGGVRECRQTVIDQERKKRKEEHSITELGRTFPPVLCGVLGGDKLSGLAPHGRLAVAFSELLSLSVAVIVGPHREHTRTCIVIIM
jgi:hypothetical protein